MAAVSHDSRPFAKFRIACVNEPGKTNKKRMSHHFNDYPIKKLSITGRTALNYQLICKVSVPLFASLINNTVSTVKHMWCQMRNDRTSVSCALWRMRDEITMPYVPYYPRICPQDWGKKSRWRSTVNKLRLKLGPPAYEARVKKICACEHARTHTQ